MVENNEKYLPIGSVVLMNGGIKKVMIVGYLAKSAEHGDRVFDYIGCLYPEGIVSSNMNLLFDHKDIKQILVMGPVDEEQKKFMFALKQIAEKYAQETTENSFKN